MLIQGRAEAGMGMTGSARAVRTAAQAVSLVFFVSAMLVLATCSVTPASTPQYSISDSGGIVVSGGSLTNSGGAWTFDAGTVPQYTTETVTFTVANSGDAAFTASGAVSFSNNDFATNVGGSFTVQPHSSSTFTGTFTPTSSSQETGTLTLTPTSGSPIVVNLKGTPDQAFEIEDANSTPITATLVQSPPFALSCGGTFNIANASTSTMITLTGTYYVTLPGALATAYSITQPPSPSITAGTSEPFSFTNTGSGAGLTDFVMITGTDSATGANFTFSFQVAGPAGGC